MRCLRLPCCWLLVTAWGHRMARGRRGRTLKPGGTPNPPIHWHRACPRFLLPNFLGPPLTAGGCWVRGVSGSRAHHAASPCGAAAVVASCSSMWGTMGTWGQMGPSLPTWHRGAPESDEDVPKGKVPARGDGTTASSSLCVFPFLFPPCLVFGSSAGNDSSPPWPRPRARAGDGRGALLSCGASPR